MKQKFCFLFICIFMFSFVQNGHAVNKVQPTENVALKSVHELNNCTTENLSTKKQLRKQKRLERRIDRLEQHLKRKLSKKSEGENIRIDLRDHTEKWMWYWIIGWALGALITIPAAIIGSNILSLFAGLFFVAGTVCLIIWLVKKFI